MEKFSLNFFFLLMQIEQWCWPLYTDIHYMRLPHKHKVQFSMLFKFFYFFSHLLSNHKKPHYCNGYFNLPFLCLFSLQNNVIFTFIYFMYCKYIFVYLLYESYSFTWRLVWKEKRNSFILLSINLLENSIEKLLNC